jgi:hypothetical protein
MAQPSTGSQVLGSSGSQVQGSDDSSERLPAIFIGIVAVEAIVIAALYWFGVHFS